MKKLLATDGDLWLGMISGTSMDGIDVAIVQFEPRLEIRHWATVPMDRTLDMHLRSALTAPDAITLQAAGRLDSMLGVAFADAAIAAISAADLQPTNINAIGMLGQTLYHAPDQDFPFTHQAGDPNRVAELTGCDVVADLRRRDMAAGGQAAPLAPALHNALFRADNEERVVLNLGGIANITVLPTLNSSQPVVGFDSGPANGLMDRWCHRHKNLPFDENGTWAASAPVDHLLLERLMGEPYLRAQPPKSTGPELFNSQWLDDQLAADGRDLDPAIVISTLAEFSAQSSADAIRKSSPDCARVIACGGGVRNSELMKRIDNRLACPLETTESYGVDPDAVEAVLCAWLAWRRIQGLPGNIPTVTGARHEAVLGGIYCA